MSDTADLFLKGILTLEPRDIVVVEYRSGIVRTDFQRALRQRFPDWRGFVLCVAPGYRILECLGAPGRRVLYEHLKAEFAPCSLHATGRLA